MSISASSSLSDLLEFVQRRDRQVLEQDGYLFGPHAGQAQHLDHAGRYLLVQFVELFEASGLNDGRDLRGQVFADAITDRGPRCLSSENS